jgi:hypothetical protein
MIAGENRLAPAKFKPVDEQLAHLKQGRVRLEGRRVLIAR